MNHWKKRGLILSLAGVLTAVSLMGCAESTVDNDKVLATVGSSEISFGSANFYARLRQARYEDYYTSQFGRTPSEFWEQDFFGQVYEESIKSEMLESLEEMYLVRQHAEEYDVALTEEEQKEIEKAAADFEEDNSLEVKEKVSGYKKYIEDYLTTVTIWHKMETPMKEGVDEEVSDEDAAQKSMDYVLFAYKAAEDGSDEEMTDDEKEELKKTAEKFLKDLKADEDQDFGAAAEEAGLEVETVTFDSDSTSPHVDLIEAADKLKENEFTDVIETSNGLYVGKVTSLLDRKATDEKKESIVEGRKNDQYQSLVDKWKSEADIEVDQELWQEIKFADSGVSDKQSGMSDKQDKSDDGDEKKDSAESEEPEDEEDGDTDE